MAGRLTGGISWWTAIAAAGALAGGCGEAGTDTEGTNSPTNTGAQVDCQPAVFVDIAITGDVKDGGVPAGAGVSVRIEEREFAPGLQVHGEAITDASGSYAFTATELPMVDGCLGWAMGFFVVADDGTRSAEWAINSVLSGAWSRGEDSADLTGLPLDLDGG